MSDTPTSIVVLAEVARFLRSLKESDLHDLAEGRVKLTLDRPTARPSRSNERDFDVVGIANRLRSATSREEAGRFIDGAGLSTAETTQLMKHLDLPSGRATTEIRRERIIEATVGHRINSEAIQKPSTAI